MPGSKIEVSKNFFIYFMGTLSPVLVVVEILKKNTKENWGENDIMETLAGGFWPHFLHNKPTKFEFSIKASVSFALKGLFCYLFERSSNKTRALYCKNDKTKAEKTCFHPSQGKKNLLLPNFSVIYFSTFSTEMEKQGKMRNRKKKHWQK